MKKEKFKLHYIGQRLYKISYFENEARQHGVQRTIPFTQLKNLSFGTPILLARYIPELKTPQKCPKCKKYTLTPSGKIDNEKHTVLLCTQCGYRKIKNTNPPQAEIFGYFTLDGISHNLPKEKTEQLNKKLSIIKTDNTSKSISRACGSYSIANTTYIKDSLPELKTKIEELFREHKKEHTFTNDTNETVCTCPQCNNTENKKKQLHPDNILAYCIQKPCNCCTFINYKLINSYKWFINGRYSPLTSFILSPAKFSRGIQTVTIKNFSLKKQRKTQASLVWLYNYRQRHYLPKAMKDKLEKNNTNQFDNMF